MRGSIRHNSANPAGGWPRRKGESRHGTGGEPAARRSSRAREVSVVVPLLSGDFLAEPFRPRDTCPREGKLNFRDGEPAVLALEQVDFKPRLADHDDMASLDDEAAG